jgi:predicted Fe-Mo cluster-binding NifX family protein
VPDESSIETTPEIGPHSRRAGLLGLFAGFRLDPYVLLLVCFGGLIGGLLFVATSNDFGASGGLRGIFVACFGGICAAGIGVFVLANSNTADRFRLLFFSVVCGFSYPVVLEAAKSVAPTASEATIKAAATKVNRDPVQASDDLAMAIEQNPALRASPEAGIELAKITNQAIDEIVPKSTAPEGVKALQQIGVAAANAGYVAQAQLAIDRLGSVRSTDATLAQQAIVAALTGKENSPLSGSTAQPPSDTDKEKKP